MTDQHKKYLSDIISTIDLINDFIEPTKTFQVYQSDFKT